MPVAQFPRLGFDMVNINHGRKPYTPWLVVGLVPAAVGIWLVTH